MITACTVDEKINITEIGNNFLIAPTRDRLIANYCENVRRLAKYGVKCSSTLKGKDVKAKCSTGCIGCGICAKQCEFGAITVENNIAHIDYEKCTGCGKCAEKCPQKIISML